MQDVLGVLEGKATFDGPTYARSLRVAEHDGRIYIDLADDALPMPLATHVGFGPPGFFHQERQGRLLLAPRFQLVADRTGAWHQGHQAEALL